jgi:hypothetical protein
VDGASSRLSDAALSHIQAGFGVGRQRTKGEDGTKVCLVKQLRVQRAEGLAISGGRVREALSQPQVASILLPWIAFVEANHPAAVEM